MPFRHRAARLALAVVASAPLLLAVPCARADEQSDRFFHDVEIDYASGVERLLQQGFDPNVRDAYGQVALTNALQNQSLKVAKVLWEAPNIEIDARNHAGETPLMMAALKGEVDAVAALLQRGAAAQNAGWSPLHYAATGGNVEIVKMLLARGAVLESRSPNGTTPLMMAARYGSEGAVDALLAAGADRTLKNDRGLDAAAFAAASGRDFLVSRLTAGPAKR